MELEDNSKLPFLGMAIIRNGPQLDTKVLHERHQLGDLSQKIDAVVQPVYTGQKIKGQFKPKEHKPQLQFLIIIVLMFTICPLLLAVEESSSYTQNYLNS